MAVSVQVPTASDNTLAEANISLPAVGPSLSSVTFLLNPVKNNPSGGKWSSYPPEPQAFSKNVHIF